LETTVQSLAGFGVEAAIEDISSVAELKKHMPEWANRGVRVIIVGCNSGSNNIASRIANSSKLPVIAVPLAPSLPANPKAIEKCFSSSGPVAVVAIGEAGARNAALSAIAILALSDQVLQRKLHRFRREQTAKVLKLSLPR
jgi:5-(carboxyamino)imidazole ribonucleotide mutase